MAQGAELGQDERRPLILGQPLEVGQQVAQVLALLDLGREPLDRGLGNVVEGALLLAGAQDGQAAVAGDGVEPRLELHRPVAGEEVAIRGDEGVLDGVLGLLGRPEHVPAEREDPPVVPVIYGLEGPLVAGTQQPHELFVS